MNSTVNIRGIPQRIFESGEKGKKHLFILCSFWSMVAILEFVQDYLGYSLSYSPFNIADSLAFKLYWLLFIPVTPAVFYGQEKLMQKTHGYLLYFGTTLLIIIISIFHLLIFSFLLYGISNFIHSNPWDFLYLVTQKLSSRLYISLSVNLVIVGYYFWMQQKKPSPSKLKEAINQIAVKNGKKSVIVPTDEIKWISSEGPYLFLHTEEKKHIVTNSLKGIITTLPDNFTRIHRSSIVNTNMIKELKSRLNGDYDVLLHDGQILRLSRNYSHHLKGTLL